MESNPLPMNPLTKVWPKSNILIVDDEPRILQQIENDLFTEDFSLFTARSAEDGMKLLDHQEVQVIVCDQKMPGGLCGTEFLYQARLNKPHIVGIILSAYGEPEYLLNAMNKAEVFRYILKPWNKKELIEILFQALQRCQINLLIETFKKDGDLSYNDRMFAESIKELVKTQRSLQEAIYSLTSISQLSDKMSHLLKERLRDSLGYRACSND